MLSITVTCGGGGIVDQHRVCSGRGCYFQEGNEINMDMDLETAFTKSMQTLGTWLDAELSPKTQVFFRSFASVHFR